MKADTRTHFEYPPGKPLGAKFCGCQGTSGVYSSVYYRDMDLGVQRMLLLVAGNIIHFSSITSSSRSPSRDIIYISLICVGEPGGWSTHSVAQ